LIDQVDRTMPAMVRLMELQEQGWAYIKPYDSAEYRSAMAGMDRGII
jgi:hypothetical protein